MTKGKKFIAPGCWFSMIYPTNWNEFEDSENSFLFYDPEKWTGNFRISAFRENLTASDYQHFGDDACQNDLKNNISAKAVEVGNYHCSYSQVEFEEDGNKYITHLWITGSGNTLLECTFTTIESESLSEAETVISSIEIRDAEVKYPIEYIPVRVLEIFEIDEAFEWTTHLVKEQLTVDFQGQEEDLPHLQEAIEKGNLSVKNHNPWINIGITLCCIIANEIDGTEWNTMIDGNREAPILVYKEHFIDPLKLVWSKVKRGENCDVVKIYEEVIASL
jgi:hypothetical protein